MKRWKRKDDVASENQRSGRWGKTPDFVKEKEDKAYDQYADLIIKKLKDFQGNWRKPWFADGPVWPKSLYGKNYNGMNALMLSLYCDEQGYKIPVFATFPRISSMNFMEDNDGSRVPAVDPKTGEKLPLVHILKDSKSFPVFLSQTNVVHNETKEKIPYSDYVQLPPAEQENYAVYQNYKVYPVYAVEQTNLKEARPELWERLEKDCQVKCSEDNGMDFSFEPVDRMIRDQQWICPIKPKHGDEAYFSISKNEIVVPEKAQFKDGESFYSNLFHEMTHSTGHESQLARIKPTSFGSAEYAREELVAELSAALTAKRYNIEAHLKEDTLPYLKNWLEILHEEPQFIKSTLLDVKKASFILSQHIDKMAEQIKQSQGVTEDGAVAKSAPTASVQEAPTYYTSVAFFQFANDTRLFDRLQEQGDYKRILAEAAEYDNGDAPNLSLTFKSPVQNCGDDLLDENDHYAVVYNNSVGGTYEVFRKLSESQVQETLTRYGLPDNATSDVKEVAAKMSESQQEKQEIETLSPNNVPSDMKAFIEDFNKAQVKTEDLVDVDNDKYPYYSLPDVLQSLYVEYDRAKSEAMEMWHSPFVFEGDKQQYKNKMDAAYVAFVSALFQRLNLPVPERSATVLKEQEPVSVKAPQEQKVDIRETVDSTPLVDEDGNGISDDDTSLVADKKQGEDEENSSEEKQTRVVRWHR